MRRLVWWPTLSAALAFLALLQTVSGLYAWSSAEYDHMRCFDKDKWPKANGEQFRCRKGSDGKYPCAVKIGVNSWIGSMVTALLATIFFEEFLGYPVEISANFSAGVGFENATESENDGNNMWSRLSSGTIDTVLEVWPSGRRDSYFKYMIEESTIVDGGALGATGRIGWYMPTYVQEDFSYSLEYWRTLLVPSNANIFRLQDMVDAPCCSSDLSMEKNRSRFPCIPSASKGGTSLENGGIKNSNVCDIHPTLRIPQRAPRFLGGAEDWSNVDDQLIRNLKMNFTVQYAGTEEYLIEEVEKAMSLRQPVMFYFWKPHALFQLFNFTRVMLPTNTDQCWGKLVEGGVDCDYPVEVLYKMYSKNFAEAKPDVALFINAFRYSSTEEQEEILAGWYKNSSVNLKSVVCDWAKRNEWTWSSWTKAVEKQYEGGLWRQEELTPQRKVCGCNEHGRRKVVEFINHSIYESSCLVEFTVAEDVCETGAYSLYSTRWTSREFPVQSVGYAECHHIPMDVDAANVVIILSAAASMILLVIGIGVFYYRRSPAIKAARAPTIFSFLFGGVLLNTSLLFMLGQPSAVTCSLRISCIIFGIIYFVGSLLIKQVILASIMRTKYLMSKKCVWRRTLVLRFQFTTLSVCGILFVGIWFGVSGLEPVNVTRMVLNANYEYLKCPNETWLMIVYLFVTFVVLVLSCVIAQQTRNYSGLIFAEAKFMFFSNYNAGIMLLFTMMLTFMKGLDTRQQIVFISVCIVFCTVVTAILLSGTRVYAAFVGKTEPYTNPRTNFTNANNTTHNFGPAEVDNDLDRVPQASAAVQQAEFSGKNLLVQA